MAPLGFKPLKNFWEKIVITPSGCWKWIGAIGGQYGSLRRNNIGLSAHQFSYLTFVGSVPEGLELDHLCLNKLCVNPDHLEAVTRAENIRRSRRLWTHCKRGHPYVPSNLYYKSNGTRRCRECALMQNAYSKAGLSVRYV